MSKAVFGQASYAVTPKIKATVGGRYSWDSVTRTGSNDLRCDIAVIPSFLYGALGCAGTPPVQNTPANGRQTASKFTYRLGLDWDVTPQNMLYAKFDTGYKPGGFSTDPTNPNNQFGPETVQSFEFGSKNRFFDGRLTFNADVFYQVLDGFQATLPRSLGAGTINAGKTNTYGAEIFARAALTSSTRIDISNNRLPNAPDVVLAGGIDQDIPLGHGKVTLRLDGRYSSQVYFDFVNRADTRAPAVAVGNFTIGYEQGPWRVQAFAKNFTDALVYARINRTSLITAQTWQFQAPRTLGVHCTYRF
nr:TonB-dependent receptor [Novosphingobium sp. SG751A]